MAVTVEVETFVTYTLGIIVFLVGMQINRMIPILRSFNIPEPVTGGLIASLLTLLVYESLDLEIVFNMASRDLLLVYFFTCIGLNARITDLIRGGRPLLILLLLTIGYLLLQIYLKTAGNS